MREEMRGEGEREKVWWVDLGLAAILGWRLGQVGYV